MRIILEKSEILEILGKHFGATLDPEKVVIRHDPILEIELSGLAMSPGKAPPAKGDSFTPPHGELVRDDSSIEEVLQTSSELMRSERNVLSAVPNNIDDEVS